MRVMSSTSEVSVTRAPIGREVCRLSSSRTFGATTS